MKKTIILVMLACFIFSGCASKRENADEGSQLQEVQAKELSESYDQAVGKGNDIIDIFIDNTKGELEASKIDEELKSLKDEFKDDIEIIYYASEDGRFFMDQDIELPEDYDPRRRSWYENALEKGKYISDVYEDASNGNRLVTIAEVVVENGETKGVVGIDMVLK